MTNCLCLSLIKITLLQIHLCKRIVFLHFQVIIKTSLITHNWICLTTITAKLNLPIKFSNNLKSSLNLAVVKTNSNNLISLTSKRNRLCSNNNGQTNFLLESQKNINNNYSPSIKTQTRIFLMFLTLIISIASHLNSSRLIKSKLTSITISIKLAREVSHKSKLYHLIYKKSGIKLHQTRGLLWNICKII